MQRRGSRVRSDSRSHSPAADRPQTAGAALGAGAPASSARPPLPDSGAAAALREQARASQAAVAAMQAENEGLKRQLALAKANLRMASEAAPSSSAPGGPLSPRSAAAANSVALPRAAPSADGASVSVPRGEWAELERQLRDRNAQVLLLKGRYEHLEAKAAAERELYDRAVAALEEQNAALRDTRGALQAAEHDVELLRGRLRGTADLEDELRRSREEVRRLEVSRSSGVAMWPRPAGTWR
jgi:hypothetical protein